MLYGDSDTAERRPITSWEKDSWIWTHEVLSSLSFFAWTALLLWRQDAKDDIINAKIGGHWVCWKHFPRTRIHTHTHRTKHLYIFLCKLVLINVSMLESEIEIYTANGLNGINNTAQESNCSAASVQIWRTEYEFLLYYQAFMLGFWITGLITSLYQKGRCVLLTFFPPGKGVRVASLKVCLWNKALWSQRSQDFVWKIETRIQRLIQWSLMWASVSGMDGAAASVHACLFCDWEVSVAEDYGQVPEYISLLFNFISNLFTPATMWRSPWSLRKPQTSSEPTQMLVTHWAAAPAPPRPLTHTHTPLLNDWHVLFQQCGWKMVSLMPGGPYLRSRLVGCSSASSVCQVTPVTKQRSK